MLRRHFLASGLAWGAIPAKASTYSAEIYAPTTWPEIRDGNDRVVLNFRASWSITCQIKEELISDLLMQNTDYDRLTFVDVNWDTFGQSVWVQQRLKVERRSTLIALRGTSEIARIVNQPYEHNIRAFLDTALNA